MRMFGMYRAIKTLHFTTEATADITLKVGNIGMAIDADGNTVTIDGDEIIKMVSDTATTVTLTNGSEGNAVVIVNGTAETVASKGTKTVTLAAGVPQLVTVLFA